MKTNPYLPSGRSSPGAPATRPARPASLRATDDLAKAAAEHCKLGLPLLSRVDQPSA